MRRFIAALVALAALAVAGPAGAATWQVYLGEQAKPPAGTPKGATLNAFFPAALRSTPATRSCSRARRFHTATLPRRDCARAACSCPTRRRAPTPGSTTRPGRRSTSTALPKLIYNPAVFAPAGGNDDHGEGLRVERCALAAARRQAGRARRYTFPKAGAFKLICTVHPGMAMIVVVTWSRPCSVPDAAAVEDDRDGRRRRQRGRRHAASRRPSRAAEHGLRGRRRQDDDPRLLPGS